MIIKVNNEIRTVNDNMKLSDIIALSNAKGIAIAVNSRIIKKEKNRDNKYRNWNERDKRD